MGITATKDSYQEWSLHIRAFMAQFKVLPNLLQETEKTYSVAGTREWEKDCIITLSPTME